MTDVQSTPTRTSDPTVSPAADNASPDSAHVASYLAGRAVNNLVAQARGYRPVTFIEARSIFGGGKARGGRTPAGVSEKDWPGAFAVPLFHPGDTSPTVTQLRVNEPLDDGTGKKLRWFTPLGSERGSAHGDLPADVNPACPREWLDNPIIPLLVTEGAVKGDAMLSALLDTNLAAVCVSLTGVTMGTARNHRGRPGLVPDLARLLSCSTGQDPRPVVLVWDSDLVDNATVRSSLQTLTTAFRAAGARVTIAVLPHAEDGSKQGVDDWLAAGGRIEHLLDSEHGLLVDDLSKVAPSTPADVEKRPFTPWAPRVDSNVVVNHGARVIERSKIVIVDGEEEVRTEVLASFAGHIVRTIIPTTIGDDHRFVTGDSDYVLQVTFTHPVFGDSGRGDLVTDEVRVPSDKIGTELGTRIRQRRGGNRAIITAGVPGAAGLVANAILQDDQSLGAVEQHDLKTTGWWASESGWRFVHCGGSISAAGAHDPSEIATVPGSESPLRMAVMPVPADAAEALRWAREWASEWMFAESVDRLQQERLEREPDVTAKQIADANNRLPISAVLPLGMMLAARAAMAGISTVEGAKIPRTVILFEGKPKSGKTVFASAIASHLGPDFASSPFAAFSTKSTSAGFERTIASATNILVVVDDMKVGSSREALIHIELFQALCDAVFNNLAIARSDKSLGVHATRMATGAIIVTSEGLPIKADTASHLSRSFTLRLPAGWQIANGDIFRHLTIDDARLVASRGMSGFLRWQAAQLDTFGTDDPVASVVAWRQTLTPLATEITDRAISLLPEGEARSLRTDEMRTTLAGRDWALGAAAVINYFTEIGVLADDTDRDAAVLQFARGLRFTFSHTLQAMQLGSNSTAALDQLFEKVRAGFAHFSTGDGKNPRPASDDVAAAWGWKPGTSILEGNWPKPNTPEVGFIRNGRLYLNLEAIAHARLLTNTVGQALDLRQLRAALDAAVDENGVSLVIRDPDGVRDLKVKVAGASKRIFTIDAIRAGLPLDAEKVPAAPSVV